MVSKTEEGSVHSARRSGFTLIELLTVIVIIGILATILISGAQFVVRLSRQKRYDVSCMALRTALSRYRAEYNVWPLGGKVPDPTDFKVSFSDDNAEVFNMLREDNQTDNPKGIRFLDETTMFTRYNGNRTTLLRARLAAGSGSSKSFPLIYVDPESGEDRYFHVTFDVDDETVEVGAQ